MKKLSFLALSLLISTASFAGTLASDKGLSLSGIKIEESKFSDVTQAFGKNTVIQTGDAATSEAYVCYLSQDGTQAIYFTSDEMGGGIIIDGIDLKIATVISAKECAPTNKNFVLDNGLKLGANPTQVDAVLGTPASSGLNVSNFAYEKDILLDNLTFTQSLQVTVLYSDQDSVSEIIINETTVN